MVHGRFAMAGGPAQSRQTGGGPLFPYVVGGATATKLSGNASLYNPATNQWGPSLPDGVAYLYGPSTPSNVDPNNDLYDLIFGGVNVTTGKPTSQVYEWISHTMAQLSNMPLARAFGGSAWAPNGNAYLMGGLASTGATTSNQQYDPTTDSWTPKAAMPTPRFGLGVAEAGGKVYAIGGHRKGSGDLTKVEVYSPTSDTWAAAAPMPAPRSLFAAVTGSDGKIYAVGGVQGASYLRRVDVYDPASDTWSCTTPMPTARAAFVSTAIGAEIYVIGGLNASGPTSSVEGYDMTPPADVAPPVFNHAPLVGFTSGTVLGTASVPVHLTYPATDAATDVRKYDVTVSTDGGPPSPVVLPWDAFSNGYVSIVPGSSSYQYAATATDCAGNTSPTRTGPTFHVHAAQESNATRYSSGWLASASSAYYGGHDRYTVVKGAKASHTFVGDDIAWVSPKSSGRGYADVYLDGHLVAKVNLHAAHLVSREIVFQHQWKAVGTHRITIVNLGTTGRPRIDIDAFLNIG